MKQDEKVKHTILLGLLGLLLLMQPQTFTKVIHIQGEWQTTLWVRCPPSCLGGPYEIVDYQTTFLGGSK